MNEIVERLEAELRGCRAKQSNLLKLSQLVEQGDQTALQEMAYSEGEIDYYFTRGRLELGHRLLAINTEALLIQNQIETLKILTSLKSQLSELDKIATCF